MILVWVGCVLNLFYFVYLDAVLVVCAGGFVCLRYGLLVLILFGVLLVIVGVCWCLRFLCCLFVRFVL